MNQDASVHKIARVVLLILLSVIITGLGFIAAMICGLDSQRAAGVSLCVAGILYANHIFGEIFND